MTEPTSGNGIADSRRILLLGIWTAALLVAILLYFGLNAPLQRAATNLKPLLLGLFFLLSFTGFGFPAARRFVNHADQGTQFLCASAFGIGITALYVYTLGWMGRLEAPLFLAWTLAGFVLFVIYLLRLKPRLELPAWNLWNTFSAAVILLFLIQAIPFVVAPELTTDALEFHLLVPKIYLVTKNIGYVPRLVESNYPSLAEYIYTLILGLSSDIACKAFHFWTGILLLFAIGKVAAKTSPESSPALAPALFLAMPVVAIVIGWAWNDLLFTFFVTLCLLHLLNFHNAEPGVSQEKSLLLAGVMGGLASCTKYTFVMVFLGLCLLFFHGIYHWKWKWKHLILFAIPVGALSCVWMVKNLVLTGNPFYPFLNSIFQSPTWNDAANTYFRGTLSKYELPEWNWKMVFLFPYYMTLNPRIVDVHMGILPLLLVPLLFLRAESRSLRLLKIYVLCYLVVWLFIRTEVRSLLSLLVALWCIYAAELQRIRWPGARIQAAFVTLMGLAVASGFFITIFSTYYLFDPLAHFFGRETKAVYRARLGENQRAYDFLNQRTDVGKVLLIGMHNPFYLRYEPVFSSCCDPPVAEWISSGAKNASEIAERVRNAGVTHVIFDAKLYEGDNTNGLYSWPAEQRRTFEDFLTTHCIKQAEFGGDTVLAVKN